MKRIPSTHSDPVNRQIPLAVPVGWQADVVFLPRITWFCLFPASQAKTTGESSVCPSAKSRLPKSQPKGKHHECKNFVNDTPPKARLGNWCGNPAG
jgi:hypothetical protein